MDIIHGFNVVNMDLLEYSDIDLDMSMKIQSILEDTKNKFDEMEKVRNFLKK